MKTNIILALDNRRPKSNGTFSIILRIVHNRNSSQITTGYSVQERDWDDKARKIKTTFKGSDSVARLNNILLKKKTEAMDIISRLDEAKTLDSFSVLQLKEMIEGKSGKDSFFTYGNRQVEEMRKAKRVGNARYYKSALSALRAYCKGKDLPFKALNYSFLLKLETTHLAKGNSLNGLAAYMRAYRAIFNKAIKDGIADKELYPFENYTIKTTKTRKRAIHIDAIRKIVALNIDQQSLLHHARNYFLASFYMRGMPFADLAQLRVSNLIDGRIYYQRKKTDKPYDIKLTSEIQQILDEYTAGKKEADYIFPIIKRIDIEEQYRDIEWARKAYNKRLKEIGSMCGIREGLTSYVSRHSFATRAKNLGVPIATISDMLGHADTRTTEIYLDSLQSDIMDEFHEKIIK